MFNRSRSRVLVWSLVVGACLALGLTCQVTADTTKANANTDKRPQLTESKTGETSVKAKTPDNTKGKPPASNATKSTQKGTVFNLR